MTKKKKAKKTTKKKAKKIAKRKRKIILPENYHLHQKKLEILRAIPTMPCSAISKDKQGLMFAHTQAEKVYQVYRRECESRGLVIRRIEGKTTDAKRPELIKLGKLLENVEVPCVRFEGVWEIEDVKSGEKETFGGAGDGDNDIWSANSAQTIARKQALLDYFETAWPQPTNWINVVQESLASLPPDEQIKAIEEIIPPKIAEATGIVDAMYEYLTNLKGPKK